MGEDLDTVAALGAEMHDELTHAWIVYPAGAARGLGIVSILGVVVGVWAAFPLALIDVGATYWVRWIVFAVVGAGFGLAVALVVGPAGGAPRPGDLPPAATGTVVRVGRSTHELRSLLARLGPLRIDEVSHSGEPIDAVTTEHPDDVAETAKDIAANISGDDYHPER